ETATAPSSQAALDVAGMDCASCVAHVEKAARQVPGVQGCDVSLARGRAVVKFDPNRTDPHAVAQAISAIGYPAAPESPGVAAGNVEEQRVNRQRREANAWLRRALAGVLLWLPVELLHWTLYLTSGGQMRMWMDWLAFATSSVAIVYVGWGFYRGALSALRRGTTNMDTLIAM